VVANASWVVRTRSDGDGGTMAAEEWDPLAALVRLAWGRSCTGRLCTRALGTERKTHDPYVGLQGHMRKTCTV
jgi:hypothetical protein